MKKLFLILGLACVSCVPQGTQDKEAAVWHERAQNITIIRDDWGVPHIHGETDADAVFGLMYAQAEDDFNRIEVNFLTSQGRMAEAEGAEEIWADLRMKLFIVPEEMRSMYQESPQWLKDLMKTAPPFDELVPMGNDQGLFMLGKKNAYYLVYCQAGQTQTNFFWVLTRFE